MRRSAVRLEPLELACLAVAAVGVALRFTRLNEPVVLMEFTALPRLDGVGALLRGLYSPATDVGDPPLFQLVLYGWLEAFGGGAAGLHLLSAALGAAGVAAAGWAAGVIGGRRAGLLTTALVSLHPMAVAYSQEARSYAALLALSGLSLGLLARALREGGPARWRRWSLAAAAAALTHNYGLFLWAAQAAYAAVALRRSRLALGGFARALALGGLVYAPWIPGLLAQSRAPAIPVDRVPSIDAAVALSGLRLRVEEMSAGVPAPWVVPLLVVELLLASWAALTLGRASRSAFALLAACGPGALLAPWALSFFKPIFSPYRHAVVALPAVCAFAALCLDRIQDKRGRALFAALALALLAAPLADYLSRPKLPAVLSEIASAARTAQESGLLLVTPCALLTNTLERLEPGLAAAARELPPEPPPRVALLRLSRNGELRAPSERDAKTLRERYRLAERREFEGDRARLEAYERLR